MQIEFVREFNRNILGVYISDGDKVAAPVDLVFTEIDPGEMVKPTFSIMASRGKEFLAALTEGLESYGVFKKQDTAQVDAIKYHLEDMRKLVFEDTDAGR